MAFVTTLLPVSLLLLSTLLHPIRTAYKGHPCPSPCRCYEFLGIQSAYCNNTGISAVPQGIPEDTQLLDLSRNPITFIKVGAINNLPNLQYIVLNSNGYHEGSIEFGALDLPKLTDIDLDDNSYTSIPKSLPNKMTSLTIDLNQITVLKADSFNGYPNLQTLRLENNGLYKIETKAFTPLPALQSLSIRFNNLTDSGIPPNLFSKNLNLTQLEMRFNKFKHVLPDLPPSVQYVDYVGNQITMLPAYALQTTPNLNTFEAWQGQMTTLEDNAFYGLHKLTLLDFMENKISSVLTKDTFNGLTGLQTLYLDENNISRIEPGALRSFSSLSSLWLQANQLSALDPEVLDVKYIPKLSELYIDTNPWYCDCHLRWLREKVGNASYVIQDPHLITCAGPAKIAGKAWDVLQPSDFVCP
ncbi:slit homolog 3 protein-like [Mercenaria mercenaria]|uniref:slit homolog 3 protein-like n=1 Tax=Mercenaria mercenaria TaxID=6596 RepID=UPI00234EE21E|nr:slit homolog 3 protein-like [Mercenaria mercenaria]